MALVRIASVDDLKDGEGKIVTANGEAVALFRTNGKFYATTNTCPHKGGPLGEGFLEDSVVTCPWHGWKFNIQTGISPVAPAVKIQTFDVSISGNDVMIEMP